MLWDTHPEIAPLGRMLLPMFFCLSGFLVTGSALRVKKLKTFFAFRILRIIPALMVEVTLSAIVLGALVTTLPLGIYYAHPDFFAYFGNIIGRIRLDLPGVFLSNPIYGIVNVNLWTIRPEFYCYGLMLLAMVSGLIFNRKLYCLLFFAGSLLFFAFIPDEAIFWNNRNGPIGEWGTVYAFLLGSMLFLFKEFIPVNRVLFLACFILGYVLLGFKEMVLYGLFPVAYCTIYLGMMKFPRISLLQRGDYSYGIYLYGFPITQALWHYVPVLREWGAMMMVAPIVTFLFAAFSWHIIEKPALKLKSLVLKKN